MVSNLTQWLYDSNRNGPDWDVPYPGDPSGPTANGDNQIVVYSRCTDPVSRQQRAVQVLLAVPIQQGGDYFGQAGMGFGNQGNANNTR